jgi:hypothetical protein
MITPLGSGGYIRTLRQPNSLSTPSALRRSSDGLGGVVVMLQ